MNFLKKQNRTILKKNDNKRNGHLKTKAFFTKRKSFLVKKAFYGNEKDACEEKFEIKA